MRKIISEALWLSIGQIISIVCSYFFIYFFARNLSLTQYGELSLALTVTSLFSGIAMGGLAAGVGRYFIHASNNRNILIYTSEVKKLVFIFSLMIIIICNIAYVILSMKYNINKYIYYLSIIYSLISSINNILISIQNASLDRKIQVYFSSLDSILRILIPAMFFFLLTGGEIIAILLGMILSSTIIMIGRYKYISKIIINYINDSKIIVENYKNKILNFSYPFILWGGFGWLQQCSIKWALGIFGSFEDIANYTFIFQISYTPIVLLGDLILNLILPLLYNEKNIYIKLRKLLMKIILLISLILLLLLSVMQIWGNDILINTNLQKYINSTKYFNFLILSSFIFIIAQIISSIYYVSERTVNLMFPSIASSIIGIASAFYLVSLYGIIGALYASIFHSTLYLLFILINLFINKNVLFKN